MTRDEAREEIRRNWRRLYPADKHGGIICPLCGNGSGKDGDGITENPRKPGQLACWKCDFKGDAIDLVRQAEKCDGYDEALHRAADMLGITIEATRSDRREYPTTAQDVAGAPAQPTGDNLTVAPAGAPQEATGAAEGVSDYTAYYRECAARLSDPAALLYLQARGISPETAAAYKVGYDPAWISPTVAKQQAAKGSAWRPDPTARLILPVKKNHYIVRAIDPAVTKYAKMNETGGGEVRIFNSRAMYHNDVIFVVEGIFDALSIIEAGSAAIALNSTSNAQKLIDGLEKKPTRATLILCLDDDDAGRRATEVLREGLARLNVSYVQADICCGRKDPNEALVSNPDGFRAAIRRAIAKATKPDNSWEYIDCLMSGEIDRMKTASDRKTGFDKLDEKSGGLYPGLYVVAATSSLGKTTFCLQLADNLAAAGHDVLFFSLEQSRLELISKSFSRILAQEKGLQVSSLSLRKGSHEKELQEAAGIYKARIADRLSIVEGNFNCDISFIGDYVWRYVARNQTRPIVFIDYLQILQPPKDEKRNTSIRETVDNTVTELRRISRELDLTVFIISSVNRSNYLTPIDFESLKESGGIEYTADVVWGLQLQCLNDPLFDSPNKIKEKRELVRKEKSANPRKIELVCLKNRYGVSTFSCGFNYYPDRDLFDGADKNDFYKDYNEALFPEEPKKAGKRR